RHRHRQRTSAAIQLHRLLTPAAPALRPAPHDGRSAIARPSLSSAISMTLDPADEQHLQPTHLFSGHSEIDRSRSPRHLQPTHHSHDLMVTTHHTLHHAQATPCSIDAHNQRPPSPATQHLQSVCSSINRSHQPDAPSSTPPTHPEPASSTSEDGPPKTHSSMIHPQPTPLPSSTHHRPPVTPPAAGAREAAVAHSSTVASSIRLATASPHPAQAYPTISPCDATAAPRVRPDHSSEHLLSSRKQAAELLQPPTKNMHE
ncbi:hypothetical protein ACLOJK_004448, partial [Asimina triloba]